MNLTRSFSQNSILVFRTNSNLCMRKSTDVNMVHILVVMGPCGCGKSEVGQNLATLYQTTFLDADAFHSEANVSKMGQGIPLNDQDRVPWLKTVRGELLKKVTAANKTSPQYHQDQPKVAAVLGCSALRVMYRDILRGKNEVPFVGTSSVKLIFILLNCSPIVLEHRLQTRSGHFMKSSMLDSQLKTLEFPQGDELQDFVVVNGDLPLSEVVEEIHQKLSSIIV